MLGPPAQCPKLLCFTYGDNSPRPLVSPLSPLALLRLQPRSCRSRELRHRPRVLRHRARPRHAVLLLLLLLVVD